MKLLVPFFAFLAVPLIAVAQSSGSYECTMGELVRRVVVERQGSEPVPCEVAYYKDTEAEGQRQVLWDAQHDPEYCDARASEFVTKLEGMGWQCSAANAQRDGA